MVKLPCATGTVYQAPPASNFYHFLIQRWKPGETHRGHHQLIFLINVHRPNALKWKSFDKIDFFDQIVVKVKIRRQIVFKVFHKILIP